MPQQTSIDWLVIKLEESGIPLMSDELKMIEQAKEMNKAQLKNAFIEGSLIHKYIKFENYYNIKFNK